jgi:hypothetical protein
MKPPIADIRGGIDLIFISPEEKSSHEKPEWRM